MEIDRLLFLFAAFPFMLPAAAAIKLEDRESDLYRQKRCTKDAREFDILKFSMVADAEKDGFASCAANDGLTKVGKIICSSMRIFLAAEMHKLTKSYMILVGPGPERTGRMREYTGDLP